MKIKATAVASLGSDNTFRLTIKDDSSRIQFVDLRMTPEQFALVISARVTTDLECEVRGLDGVGKVREVKTERVSFRHLYCGTKEERERAAKQAMEPFEVDGWKGSMSDMFNGHRSARDGSDIQIVMFERLVDGPAAKKDGGA